MTFGIFSTLSVVSVLWFCQFRQSGGNSLPDLSSNGWQLGKYKKYLVEYGFLTERESKNGTPKKPHPSEVKLAITKLKMLYKFDDSTDISDIEQFMGKPRCGMTDLKPKSRRRRRYNIFSPWRITKFNYAFESYGDDLPVSEQEGLVVSAFQLWKNAIPVLEFTKSSLSSAHIKFAFARNTHSNCNYAFDGPGSSIAHTFSPEDGRIHFDDDETFTQPEDATSTNVDFFATAVHEIGHALGLDHSYKSSAVMYPIYKGYNPGIQLDDDDVAGIRALYDPPVGSDPGCVDEDPGLCASYKSAGYCSPVYEDVMEEVCPFTCDLCDS